MLQLHHAEPSLVELHHAEPSLIQLHVGSSAIQSELASHNRKSRSHSLVVRSDAQGGGDGRQQAKELHKELSDQRSALDGGDEGGRRVITIDVGMMLRRNLSATLTSSRV